MAKKRITYNEAIAQIDEVLNKFRTNEMSVDELTADVKRATELITLCKDRLYEVESDLKKILE